MTDQLRRFGDFLIAMGLVTEGQVQEALALQPLTGNRVGEALLSLGYLTRAQLQRALSAAVQQGDTVVLDFTPQNGDWAGINLKASVKVSAVRERVLPPLDDTFAQLASEFDTVSELQDHIRIQIRQLKEQGQINEARDHVLEYFGTLELPLPQALIAAQVEAHFEDGHEGDDGHRAEMEAGARLEMTSQFVLDKVADAEGFGVDETDLGGWLTESAPRYGMTPDQLAHAIVEANQLPMAYLDIRRAKALSHVLTQVTLVNASGADVELAGL
jgi:trigger factor